jgi:hypothetical protein
MPSYDGYHVGSQLFLQNNRPTRQWQLTLPARLERNLTNVKSANLAGLDLDNYQVGSKYL